MNNLNLYLDLFHKKTIELIDLNNYIKVIIYLYYFLCILFICLLITEK